MPIPRGCLSKSDFSRDFQSADHTAFSGTPEPELVRESSKKIQNPILSFYSLLQGVDEVVKPLLSFPSLDNRTLVDQQLTFRMVTSYSGKLLEFRHHRPIQESQKVPLMSALTVIYSSTLWRPSV
ncbi:hypothetical protein AVEN_79707-1 [Araneus ventricosus]|uniref:Uncharacterized protein n=1 Tax=Araneus ventricosus TaxID=182803 RepID=A0A4Y2DBN7_ARAVE|nr:hypothetical protein AVEN_100953-1 [Araneus ventricosus]GBM14137.1 hypothetical protein AVEN_79707-1 [Araneus ventricosus]